ncbi:hypothetical protein P8610_12895 [Fictibacillus sp. UD]|uniref:hypothetical protein n=1 Tax=Fictibacillus sp. UD TaxID=3038777 RepID=UPI0037456E73
MINKVNLDKVDIRLIESIAQGYCFDKEVLKKAFGDIRTARDSIIAIIQKEINNSSMESISNNEYLIWIANRDGYNKSNRPVRTMDFCVSPAYYLLDDDYEEPCYYQLSQIEGFIEGWGCEPIRMNAIPHCLINMGEKTLIDIKESEESLKELAVKKDSIEQNIIMDDSENVVYVNAFDSHKDNYYTDIIKKISAHKKEDE